MTAPARPRPPGEHATGNGPEPVAIAVRPFRPSDQAAAKALILAGLAEHWGTLDPTLNPDLDDIATTYADGVFLVACAGERIVGTGALVPSGEGTAQIVRMSVAAEVRRRGIGRRIIAALCDAARARGYRRLVLETTSTWTGAIAFYVGAGFRHTHTHNGDTYFERPLP